MKDDRPYLVECQAIKETKINDIPKHGKTHFKRRQITIQNVAFYNAINGILETRKNQQNNNQNKKTMKHKRTENKSGLIISFFRLPKKLDLKGKEVIVKIIKRIIRKSCKI